MGGRKLPRKVQPPAERVDREPVGGEVDDDSTTMSPPKAEISAAGECEEVSEADEEDIGRLLELFTRDELRDLLTDACLRDPALLARVAASAASDAAHRRLFVHGLGPGATSTALAAAFVPFGALDECHAVADRATGRCRGYGFVTFRRRSDARRALADSSKRVDGRPVACQLASFGPVAPASSFSVRKLFVDNVPERAGRDDLREFFSKFGEIEEGPLGSDRTTGLFRGYAIFVYKTPEGLRKALEEPTKVFDGCELHCRLAHRARKRKQAPAAPADNGDQSNGAAATLPTVQLQSEDTALTPKLPLLCSNPQNRLTTKGSSSTTASATVAFRRNAAASGGAGILGAGPVATAVPSLPVQSTTSTPPSEGVLGPGALGDTARAGASSMVPTTIGATNSPSSLQVQGPGALKDSCLSSMGLSTLASRTGQWSARPGLIQHYLGR
jgi:heterogeneous nuclear ribonucleoprotein A1/A3